MVADNKSITIIGPCPPPIGGVSESVRKLIKILVKNNENVKIFDTSSGKEREDLYKRKTFMSYIKGFLTIINFVSFSFSNRTNEYHLFTTSGSGFLRDIPLILISRVISHRLIIHFHSKKKGELFLSRYLIHILFFFLNFADAIIVLSKDHEKYFSSYARKNIFVMENFCLSDEFSISHGDSTDILYCGRISKQKGFFDLLHGLKEIKFQEKITLNVLGLPDNKDTESYIVNESSFITKNIVYHGNVFGNDKKYYFSKSGCFVFPSHFENSPVVLKEAMMASLIIIASDIHENKNILRKYPGAFYYKNGDFFDLARVLDTILCLPNSEFSYLRELCVSFDKFDDKYAINTIYNIRKSLI